MDFLDKIRESIEYFSLVGLVNKREEEFLVASDGTEHRVFVKAGQELKVLGELKFVRMQEHPYDEDNTLYRIDLFVGNSGIRERIEKLEIKLTKPAHYFFSELDEPGIVRRLSQGLGILCSDEEIKKVKEMWQNMKITREIENGK